MKNFLLLLLCLGIFSLNAQSKPAKQVKKPVAKTPSVTVPPLAGKYWNNQASGSVDSLILRADSSYIFKTYQSGVSTPESFSGKWTLKKTDVFLWVGEQREPYGQVRAILTSTGDLEKLRIIRYYGNLQKGADQMDLKK